MSYVTFHHRIAAMERDKQILFPDFWKVYGFPIKVDIFKWAEVFDGHVLDEAFSWFLSEEEATANCPPSVERQEFTILKEELLVPEMWNLFDYVYMYMRDVEIERLNKPCQGCSGLTGGQQPRPRLSSHRDGCLVVPYADEEKAVNSGLTHDTATFCAHFYKVVRDKLGFPINFLHTCCEFCEFTYIKRFYPKAFLKKYYTELDMPYLMRSVLTPCYVEARKKDMEN